MGAGGAEDERDLGAEAAVPEEEDHDERVREAHFGAVDEAIAEGFDEREEVVVAGVEDDLLEGSLCVLGC